MRNEIRLRIAAGEQPEHIRQWLIARYGDYISYEPRVTSVTWPLFALPIALLAIGVLIVLRRLRRRA
jgi:cytochrome c-type biogenesis protein CcmH